MVIIKGTQSLNTPHKKDKKKQKHQRPLKVKKKEGEQRKIKIEKEKLKKQNIENETRPKSPHKNQNEMLQVGSKSIFFRRRPKELSECSKLDDNKGKSQKHNNDSNNESPRRNLFKQALKRQIWKLSKNAIRKNKHWNAVLESNNIDIDKINIDKVDLNLINVDALDIKNKNLKRTVTWLLK
ncbi:uncharacterized protein MAL13P1.304-like isoform X2 [Amyelois transitella]|uniref:uncharacterized protein MAL13P1.304-like isoform X2 n=1 Tax=Amyelois transitella TaxID=680683 RepID=UPI00298F4CED|nr:uncharacterized protein MAL13P1.304-like isoform X2 [Amyelois transitella]